MEFKNWATKFIDSQLFQAKSPLSLTTKGEKLIKESGFKAIFEIVKSELAKELLEKMAPKTRYDAQEKARSFMDDLSRKDYKSFLPIKTYAFEKGEDYVDAAINATKNVNDAAVTSLNTALTNIALNLTWLPSCKYISKGNIVFNSIN